MSRKAKSMRNLRLLSEITCKPIVEWAITQSLRKFQPDVVHALRIPYEAILSEAALRHRRQPFIVSVWGNDLTLHAVPSRWFARATKRVLSSTDALHCDCDRDVRLARTLGYRGPAVVLPTCGGLDRSVFPGSASAFDARNRLGIGPKRPIIFDPRASREYTRHDIVFAALQAVLSEFPEAVAVTVGLDGEAELRDYARKLAIDKSIIFLPKQNARQMAELYAASEVTISATEHDGTPNSILEAMACGSFPIVSNLESLREWIENGRNGFLVGLRSSSFASAIIRALRDDALRVDATARNRELIEERATREVVAPAITKLYVGALGNRQASAPRSEINSAR